MDRPCWGQYYRTPAAVTLSTCVHIYTAQPNVFGYKLCLSRKKKHSCERGNSFIQVVPMIDQSHISFGYALFKIENLWFPDGCRKGAGYNMRHISWRYKTRALVVTQTTKMRPFFWFGRWFAPTTVVQNQVRWCILCSCRDFSYVLCFLLETSSL